MVTSILTSVKMHLGVGDATFSAFDDIIISCINTVFFQLNQMGVGPETVFSISDATTTWDSFIGDALDMNAVKTYMDLKVRTLFDPPTNSVLMNAVNEQIKELEFRLTVQHDKETES